MIKKAYQLGVQLAFEESMQKTSKAKFLPRIRNFFNEAAGHNVEKAIGEHHRKIMETPVLVQQAKKTPKDMSTMESYITKALTSRRRLPGVQNPSRAEFEETASRFRQWIQDMLPISRKQNYGNATFDPAVMSEGKRELSKSLTEGFNAVKAERAKTLRARMLVGSSILAPSITGAAILKEGSLGEDVAPVAAAGVAGAAPAIQGVTSGAFGPPESKGKLIKNIKSLQGELRPGDIMLTSAPGYSSAFKAPIAAIGGDPYGYHVETVLNSPRSGNLESVHSTPAEGGASIVRERLSGNRDVIIKRLKDQSKAEEFVKNLRGYARREEVLRKMLGTYAPTEMYDAATAIKGGVKSFLPKSLHGLLSKGSPLPGNTVCSSLPGMACPVNLAPGIPKHEILPHHLQRSAALETVGHYRAPRSIGTNIYESLLRASPWVTRGAIGAGLGYGAYRGVKALTGN